MTSTSNHRLARTLSHMASPVLAAEHDYMQASKDTEHEFKTPPKTDSGKRDFPHVKLIGIVGGGVMGGGIAQMTALGGYDVIVQDISEDACQLARDEMVESRWGMKRAVEKGKITFQQCEDAIPRLTTTTDANDLADCDLIIEAVPEKLELKQNVFASLDAICKPSCIFTSNTSGFVIDEIAAKCSDARKAVFAGVSRTHTQHRLQLLPLPSVLPSHYRALISDGLIVVRCTIPTRCQR
jgi:threonine dehydrogenase-like Zn-dependent dehydrogenase